jgi:hypothetical protein
MFVLFGSGYVIAAPVFIGGSSASPPPLMVDCFDWMTTSVERACQFTVVPGGPYCVEKLEVAVFILDSWPPPPPGSAYFTINPDDAGKPGQSIASFELDGITTTQQVLVAEATQSAILNSGSLYWLVGGASTNGYVCWNLDLVNVGWWSQCGYRVDKGEWVVGTHGNIDAFAILGSPVPEPATLFLLSLGAGVLRVTSHWSRTTCLPRCSILKKPKK